MNIKKELTNALTKDFNYNLKLNYDEAKNLIVLNELTNYWQNQKQLDSTIDYEQLITLARYIYKKWLKEFKQGNLSIEHQGYMQAYAQDFIEDNKQVIIEVLEELNTIPQF